MPDFGLAICWKLGFGSKSRLQSFRSLRVRIDRKAHYSAWTAVAMQGCRRVRTWSGSRSRSFEPGLYQGVGSTASPPRFQHEAAALQPDVMRDQE